MCLRIDSIASQENHLCYAPCLSVFMVWRHAKFMSYCINTSAVLLYLFGYAVIGASSPDTVGNYEISRSLGYMLYIVVYSRIISVHKAVGNYEIYMLDKYFII